MQSDPDGKFFDPDDYQAVARLGGVKMAKLQEDIEYFKEKLFSSLGLPPSCFDNYEGSYGTMRLKEAIKHFEDMSTEEYNTLLRKANEKKEKL